MRYMNRAQQTFAMCKQLFTVVPNGWLKSGFESLG